MDSGPPRRLIGRWADIVQADHTIICLIQEYDTRWEGDRLVKRVVVEGACDDLIASERIAREQVVAELRGKRDSFDDVEKLAAKLLFNKLWAKIVPPVDADEDADEEEVKES